MKQSMTVAALIGAASAIHSQSLTQYAIGDMPDVYAPHDETDISDYDALTGRAASEEAGHTLDNVIVDLEETGDAQTRPMCFTNGDVTVDPLTVVDTQGPSDGCCRVYEAADFKGRHYDFCVYDPDQCQKKWDLDITGWHNEINSIWCAQDALFRLCSHIDDSSSTTDNWAKNECKGGQPNVLESLGKHPTLKVGVDEASDSLWVLNNNCGTDPVAAVVFDERDCNGDSYFAHPDVYYRGGPDTLGTPADYNAADQASVSPKYPKWRGSYEYYEGNNTVDFVKGGVTYTAKNEQLDGGKDESVLLSSNLEFELFTEQIGGGGSAFDGTGLFERHETYTLRQFDTVPTKSVPLNEGVNPAIYTCHNYPVDMNKSKSNGGLGGNGITLNPGTAVVQLDGSVKTGDYFTDGNSDVRAFKIRDMQMPGQ